MGLRDQLRGLLPQDLLPLLSNRFDVIGDIAILCLPERLGPYGGMIAGAVVSSRKNIVTVLNKEEKITGDSRIASYRVLFGETTVTTHREYNFSYRLDVTGSFFSSRMASERKRVTSRIRAGERVYVPFAGVGPFVIPTAAQGAEVHAAEMNPAAFRWLRENAELNHVGRNCHLRNADAFQTDSLPCASFDRIIIPAPYGMDHALDELLPLLPRSGIVHFYTFKAQEQVPALIAAFAGKGLATMSFASCGNVAPGISRWVFDMVRTRGPE